MSEDASKQRAVDGDQQSSNDRLVRALMTFVNSLVSRVALVFIVGGLVTAMIADVAYPSFMTDTYNKVAQNLAGQAKGKITTPQTVLQAMQDYNLAWYYITDANGRVDSTTEPYNPHFSSAKNESRSVDWHDKKFWEAVVPAGSGQFLHVGFQTSPVIFPEMGRGSLAMAAGMPFILTFLLQSGILAATLATVWFCVVRPLKNLQSAVCGSDDTALGAVDLSGAVSEVHSLADSVAGMKERLRRAEIAARGPDDAQLVETQAKLSETYAKDVEDEFITALGRELDALKSSHQVCQRILDKLSDKFPTSIIYGAFFKADKTDKFPLEAFLGFDDRAVQAIKRTDHQRIAKEVFQSGRHLSYNSQQLKEFGLQTFAANYSIKTAVFLPVAFQERQLGVLAVYFTKEGQMVQDRLRVLRGVVSLAAGCLYQVVNYEEELESARTDALTGVRNKKFFEEVAPQVFNRAAANPQGNPISLVMMDGDHFNKINETYGHQIGDQMLQELAKTIKQCVRTNDGDGQSGPGDFLIRFGGEEFLIIMQNADVKLASDVAERIRKAVEEKHDWPGAVPQWTVSIGVATYPTDGKTAEDVLLKADTALYYVKEELGRNKVCHIKDVPAAYQTEKQSAVIGGNLSAFDPAALLQSLASAQKTGILTVQAPNGKQLWMLLENGKPVQARLAKFGGVPAIVEFITTFEEGSFSFQDKMLSTRGTITRLPKLDDTYNVARGLERCLMDGAFSQDNFKAAKVLIPSADVLIRPIAGMEFAARWQGLGEVAEPPTAQEFEIMSEIVQRADGNTTLAEIFAALDERMTSALWRSAALLVQHGLVTVQPAVRV